MAKTVTVICYLPSGVTLELHDLDGLKERITSSAPITSPAPAMRSVTLNGAKHDPTYHKAEGRLLGRAGRTEVDADFWRAWLDQNERNQLVTQRMVFAESSPAKADSAVAERENERTGHEGATEEDLTKIGDVKKVGAE